MIDLNGRLGVIAAVFAVEALVTCRVIAATVTVPIAEELAYRGYLLRRLVSREFESVAFQSVRWPALVICAVIFAIHTGSLGEAVAGHAVTNLLLALYVLAVGDWRLW
jgi:membrane protease YdiL (CAAX protease family)